MHPFESTLSVPAEELEFELRGFTAIPWDDFLLNPRRLRGSDFLMRWSQGRWSEKRLIEAVNETDRYLALPYGPSGTAPQDDVRAFELYFERLEAAELGQIKRPDLLIFRKTDSTTVQHLVDELGGVQELPFIPETNSMLAELLSKAVIAVECENSLWEAKQMPAYGSVLTPQRRLGGKLGLKKSAVLPTVIIKEEDRTPLHRWQDRSRIKIHVWHVFFDVAFGLPLDTAEELVNTGLIEATVQTFQAPGGASSKKVIYKFYYHYAYPLGEARENATLVADYIKDKNGHILPYVRFEGGSLSMSREALAVLDQIACEGQE